MSAPYTVRYGTYYEHALLPIVSLSDAIDVCAVVQKAYKSSQFPARIIGDNVDEFCRDGLSQDEREIIESSMPLKPVAPALLEALRAMVASYDGLRDAITSPVVLKKIADADAAIAKAEGR